MNSSAKIIIFPQKTSKGYPLKIRITQKRKSVYISLKIFLTESQRSKYWNEKKKELIKSYPFYDKVYTEFENQLKLLGIKIGNTETAVTITNHIQSFTAYFKEYSSRLELKKQFGLLQKTRTVLYHLKLFYKSDIQFSDLNIDFFKNFQDYLIKNHVAPITQKGYFEKIRSIINQAIIENKYNPTRHPFLGFEFMKIVTKPKHLTPQQFKFLNSIIFGKISILNTKTKQPVPPLSDDILNTGRKFLFQYYCFGMRVSDLLLLRFSNIYESGKRLQYTMYKTKSEIDLVLSNEILDILYYFLPSIIRNTITKNSKEASGIVTINIGDKNLSYNKKTEWYDLIRSQLFVYSTHSELKHKRIFSDVPIDLDSEKTNDRKLIYSKVSTYTAYYNKDLKALSKELRIFDPTFVDISSHMARHTFAYISSLQSQNLYYLSKALAHKSVKTTENYLKGFPSRNLDKQFYKKEFEPSEKKLIDDKLKELVANADYDKKKKIIEFFSL